MSLKSNFFLFFVLIALNLSSCSRSKAYFSNQVSLENSAIQQQEPQLLVSNSTHLFSLPLDANAPTKLDMAHNLNEVGEKSSSIPVHVTTKRDLKKQQAFFQKEIKSTIQKFKAQNKTAEKKSGTSHWEPRLKIGVSLLVIGIVLSVFGLGLIGGISAFIGLLFTILGLLNTYY
jgi:hypothetical protein